MEKNQTGCPKAVCEKIFRAITFGTAFSTIRRIPSRQQTPSPAKYVRNPSLSNSEPPIRLLDIKTKLTSPQRPKPTSEEGSEFPIKFDYTTRVLSPPTEKPKPTALNGSTQENGQVPLALMAQQAKTPKPSTNMVQSGKPIVLGNGQQAQNKSKPKAEKSGGQILVQTEQHQAKEEGEKPTQHYEDTFSTFIFQTKKKIMSHNQDSGENSPKLVGHSHGHGHGGIGKDHQLSDYIDQTKRNIRTTSSVKDISESFFK